MNSRQRLNTGMAGSSGRLLLGALLLGVALLAGCATGPNAHPRDPMEPWNRGVYKVNDVVDRAVLRPVSKVYTTITPSLAQTGVRNFFSNLGDAWSTVNSVLQLKGEEAMSNFFRFTINSTFGLGGVLDVATEARLPQNKQDFGLTLGRWGVPSGPYMVLPLVGPSTLRDTVAMPVDMKGNPVGAISNVATRNVLTGLGVINHRAQMLPASELLDQAALDPYAFMRDAYLQQRDARAGWKAPKPSDAAGEDTDGYIPPSEDDEGYVPPVEDGAATASPASAAPVVPATLPASAAPVAVPASPASAAFTPETVPVAPAASPASTPAAPSATRPAPGFSDPPPYYHPALPHLLNEVYPGVGGSFWRR